MTNRLYFK